MNTKYKIQIIEYEIQNNECKIQNYVYKIQINEHKIQNHVYKIQMIEYKIQNNECKIQINGLGGWECPGGFCSLILFHWSASIKGKFCLKEKNCNWFNIDFVKSSFFFSGVKESFCGKDVVEKFSLTTQRTTEALRPWISFKNLDWELFFHGFTPPVAVLPKQPQENSGSNLVKLFN